MEVTVNHSFEKNLKSYALNFFTAGYGELDTSWSGRVVNSPFSRLYFILEGEFYILTDKGERTTLKSPNVYLVPSGSTFCYACEDHAKHLFFHLNLCTFDKIDLFGELDKVFVLKNDGALSNRELRGLVLSKNPSDTFRMEQKIRGILALILAESGIQLAKNQYTAEVQRVIEYITENLSLRLNIPQIAREAHLAPSTLTKKFKSETGMSVGEYVDRQIMFKAERMLASTRLSVSEISDALGFCDQFYFSRKFKEVYGAPPRSHRRKINI